MRDHRLVALIFTACLVAPSPLAAQQQGQVSTRVAAVQEERRQVQTKIDRLTESREKASKNESIDNALQGLRSLDALYAQEEAWTEEKEKLESRLAQERKGLEALENFTPAEPRPYSFLLLERLKDDLATEQEHERAFKVNLASTEARLKAARTELDSAGRPTEPPGSEPGKESREIKEGDPESILSGLSARTARATVASKQVESEVDSLRLEVSIVRQQQLDKKIAIVAKDVSFSAQDLAQELAVLAGKESEVKQQLREVGEQFRELKTTKGSEDAVAAADKPADVEPGADAWRVAIESYQAEVLILDQRLETLASLAQLWKRWYQLANKPPHRAELLLWQDESRDLLHRLEDQARALAQRRDVVRQSAEILPHLSEGAKRAKAGPEVRRELLDAIGDSLAEINSAERTIGRFQQELSAQIERSGNVFDNLTHSLLALVGWKVAETEGHPITIGRLVLLIAIVAAGIAGAYYLSHWFGQRVLRRLGLSRGKRVAIRSIVFYVLCLVSGVIAFKLLNIPLAAFAFVGGAAAIAVGFGSQDIMNNFMSGLILLAEQPIRVGDVIELGKVEGVVVHIGMRSTRLRTQMNHELIVPNKSLLDEQVTNYTLSDNVVRRSVKMTVERSVPIVEAKKKMLRVTRSQPLVLDTPRPVVLVTEVDNYYGTTTFEVFFAMHLNSFMECAVVQGRILQKIATHFPPVSENQDAAEANGDSADDVRPLNGLSDAAMVKELRRMQARVKPR